MAAQTPFAGSLFLHRLMRVSTFSQRYLSNRVILVKLQKCRREIRTFSTCSVKHCNNEGDKLDSPPLSAKLTSRQALLSRRRRPLSPLERISGLLPQDALSPEVMQLREQDQPEPAEDTSIRVSVAHCTTEERGHADIPRKDASDNHHASDEAAEADDPGFNGALDEEGRLVPPTLPGESLLEFGDLLIAHRKKGRVEFKKMFQLQRGMRLQSSWGVILHDDMVGQLAGRGLTTSRGVPILIRRASLEDYVLFMKRGPAIAYPKDAATMLMMMDVTEGDCVLESGSGSGAMSLFLSRAVGSTGSVVSVEVREDHQRRAVLNYSRWRTAWSVRRGREWPDNVQFHNADLSAASSLLAGRGFNAVALDMISPQLALPAVTPHLHAGAVCAVYLANITQVVDLLEGLRISALPLLCERILEVPSRDWLVAPAIQKDGSYCTRKAPIMDDDEGEEHETTGETDGEETTTEKQPAFGSIPYIARPHPEQMSHTAFLVKLRKCVQ